MFSAFCFSRAFFFFHCTRVIIVLTLLTEKNIVSDTGVTRNAHLVESCLATFTIWIAVTFKCQGTN